jgi:hypothetical protein
MSHDTPKEQQNEQAAHPHESEAEAAKRRAGKPEQSSHDHMSREKAGKNEGAGGGAKQKQNH